MKDANFYTKKPKLDQYSGLKVVCNFFHQGLFVISYQRFLYGEYQFLADYWSENS